MDLPVQRQQRRSIVFEAGVQRGEDPQFTTGTAATGTIRSDGVLVERLEVPHREVADYLHSLPGDKRPHALLQAIRVGVFCLQHARAFQDTTVVRREGDRALSEVEIKTKADVPAGEEGLVGEIRN